jgi:hypothetical protein
MFTEAPVEMDLSASRCCDSATTRCLAITGRLNVLSCYVFQVVSHVGVKIENVSTPGEEVEGVFWGFETAICH